MGSKKGNKKDWGGGDPLRESAVWDTQKMKRGKKGNSFLFSGRRNKITRSLFLTAIFVSSEKEEKPGKEREKILPSHSPKKEESPRISGKLAARIFRSVI